MNVEKCYWDSNSHRLVITLPDGQVERKRLKVVETQEIIALLAEEGWQFVRRTGIGGGVRYWFQRQVEPH